MNMLTVKIMNIKFTILNKIKSNKKGFTLVELIVSFALIGILMATVSTVFAGAYRVHIRIKSFTNSQVVSDILKETIEGELTHAKAKKGAAAGEDIKVIGTEVAFINKDGIKTRLYISDEGYLCLEYPEAEIEGDPTNMNDNQYLGTNVYLKNKIESVTFTHIPETNYIRLDMKLKDQVTGFEYTTKKVIECYNLTNDSFG